MSARQAGRGLALIVLLSASAARANPRPLPFSYPHEQLAEGNSELELYVDFTPVRARSDSSGDPVWYGLSQYQVELEHGLSDRLELGLYVTLVPQVTSGFAQVPRGITGTGLKQRLRYQLAPTGEWPLDVALYLETVENERELELEARVIEQRRFGPVRLIANVGAEHEFYWDGRRDWVLGPSAGVTFEPTPAIQPGIEWWMYAEYPQNPPPGPRPFVLGPHHYLGPVLMLQFGELWWTAGVYLRLSAPAHTLEPGEGFGRFWARSVLGVGF